MHCYFCNGVASHEVFQVVAAMDHIGCKLEQIRVLASRASWCVNDGRDKCSKVERILHDKMFEGEVYKGEAHDTRRVVYLLQYYLDVLFANSDILLQERNSFRAMKDSCASLYELETRLCVNREEDVKQLHTLQLRHQQKFFEAYGLDAMRPKHHHRLHIPEQTLLLGFVPNCALHEKKHQVLKGGGLVDRHKQKMRQAEALQRALLPRLLLQTADLAEKEGLGEWNLATPTRPAKGDLQSALQDPSLLCSKAATLLHRRVTAGEILFFSDKEAYVVQTCLRGNVIGLVLQVQPLTLREKRHGDLSGSKHLPPCISKCGLLIHLSSLCGADKKVNSFTACIDLTVFCEKKRNASVSVPNSRFAKTKNCRN